MHHLEETTMATFNRKYPSVEAVQHFGPNKSVVSSLKGEQVANSGDFLVIDRDAVNALRAQEKAEDLAANALGNPRTVYVIAKAEFLRDYDAPDATPVLVGDKGFDVPSEIDVPEPEAEPEVKADAKAEAKPAAAK
jgi:hypothetical protein